jgi:hypothetical protein
MWNRDLLIVKTAQGDDELGKGRAFAPGLGDADN